MTYLIVFAVFVALIYGFAIALVRSGSMSDDERERYLAGRKD